MTANLAALLAPRTIALVGASPDLHIFRGRTLKVMLGHPYAGRIYPVSRSHAEIQGLKAYPSVAAIPEPVDLAILIIPAEFVPDELERCGAAGVKAAMILASGFAETGSPAGQALQARIVAIAARYGLTVCGPNAEGYANTRAALCPTFSPAVDNLSVPLVPPWRSRGHVAVVAQSGGMGFGLFDRGRPKELPFSYIITTGNEACLETFEIVDHLLDEGTTDVFLLVVESIKHAATFERVAARALAAGKPIIVAKLGQSEAGTRASRSHTGAVAGDHAAYQAMFRRHGIIEAADLDEMVDLACAFSLLRERLPAGNRVGIGSASGGGGGWLADLCVSAGLTLPILDAPTRAQLDQIIPAYGSSQNPVDATAQAILTSGYGELARLIAASDAVDAVIMIVSARLTASFEKEFDKLAAIAKASAKPIVMWSYTMPSPETTRLLSQAGYPLFTSMTACARALAAMVRYRAVRERRLRAPAIAAPPPAMLSTGPASAVLRAYGISTAERPIPGSSIQVAVRCDPTFGPLLHVGFAGRTALAPVPLSDVEAGELLERVGLTDLQGADLPAVVDLLVRLSCLASDSADLEIELEDVVVHERGEGLTVARARLVERPDL